MRGGERLKRPWQPHPVTVRVERRRTAPPWRTGRPPFQLPARLPADRCDSAYPVGEPQLRQVALDDPPTMIHVDELPDAVQQALLLDVRQRTVPGVGQ